MNKEVVFITGGSGFVGSQIINELLTAGYKVKALVRNPLTEKLPHNVEAVSGDLLNIDAWKDSVVGVDIFINLVGIIREFPEHGVTFQRLHVDATECAIKACKYAKVERYLHMSANGAAVNGVSGYQRTKYQAEQLVVNSGLNYTIFRPSLIFGLKDKFLNVFAENIKKYPIFPIFGDGKYKLQPVSVEDVAAAYVKSIHNEECHNKIFHLGGEKSYEYIELIKALSKALDRKIYLPQIPLYIMRPITKIMGRYKFFPITIDQLNMLAAGNTCPETKIFDILNIERINLDNYIALNYEIL